MRIGIADAARQLEDRGELERNRFDHSARIIEHVRQQVGQPLPPDLEDFYRERVASVGDFVAFAPVWNDRMGWRPVAVEATRLLHAQAVPIFLDGCGSLFGLELASSDDVPAVYFFDHEDQFQRPRWAAGSSLGAFMLLLADGDRAQREGWAPKWELTVDPDLDKCPRAPAIWNAAS